MAWVEVFCKDLGFLLRVSGGCQPRVGTVILKLHRPSLSVRLKSGCHWTLGLQGGGLSDGYYVAD